MSNVSLVIMAAGMGSRYGGLKQLESVGPSGETIMDYSIYDAIRAGFKKFVFIVRKDFSKQFEETINKKYGDLASFYFVEQELNKIPEGTTLPPLREKPWGTGHAMLVASEVVNEPFGIINADDFYGAESMKNLYNFLYESIDKPHTYGMIGFKAGNTLSDSGSVSRGICLSDEHNFLTSVEEHHNIMYRDGKLTGENSLGAVKAIDPESPVSMNMWGFTPDIFEYSSNLFKEFLLKDSENLKKEFYIPFIVNEIILANLAPVKILKTGDNWFGITYKEDKDKVVNEINKLTSLNIYPKKLF